jgi:hypothetical protein
MLLDEQKHKWNELNTFFKNNSKYYKQIDNKEEITFFVYSCGAGGNFLMHLFLDEAGVSIDASNTYPGPPEDKIISMRPPEIFGKRDNYDILKYLDVSSIKDIKVVDEDLKNGFLTIATTNINFVTTHMLPVVAYFYYKHPKKIKTIFIDTWPKIHFTNILCIIKKKSDSPAIIKTLFKDPGGYMGLNLIDVYPKLTTLNYEKLFFNRDEDTILKLMDIFNSKKSLSYYKTKIKKYHAINLKLVTQFKNNIVALLENDYKSIKADIDYDRFCGKE